MTTTSTSRSDLELIELWRRQEEVDTARIEQEARDTWTAEIEPARRQEYLEGDGVQGIRGGDGVRHPRRDRRYGRARGGEMTAAMTSMTSPHTGVLCTVHGAMEVVGINPDPDDYCRSIARQIGTDKQVVPVNQVLWLGRLDDLNLWVADCDGAAEPNIGATIFARTLGLPRDEWLFGDVLITGGASYDTGEALDLTAEQLRSLVGPPEPGDDTTS
jgi:hypothetical protein